MPSKEQLRQIVRDRLDAILTRVNAALRGENLDELETVLTRLGKGRQLPHWYRGLKANHALPNLDGKTIGSVVEMLLVAVLETMVFATFGIGPLRMNPARGVDLPDLDLGIKSPSENYCTSEPFFSAYERLLDSEFDAVVLLTDYQQAKKNPPLRLQILQGRYLTKTQIADEGLCRLAKKHRDWLLSQNEAWARKLFRFFAFVNQSDWRAKRLLKLIDRLQDERQIQTELHVAEADFQSKNRKRFGKDKLLIPDVEVEALRRIATIQPAYLGVIDAADNWVVEVQKDLGRFANDNEWQRLLSSPLDGQIGMSFALQWRYNFGKLFGVREAEDEE